MKPSSDVLEAWKQLDAAQKASEKASEARFALSPGSTRARVTSANARWANAAEDRDRKVAAYRDALAAEMQRLQPTAADPPTTRVLEDIASERAHQLERYDRDHDDDHFGGELADAAAVLAVSRLCGRLDTPHWAHELRRKLARARQSNRRRLVVAATLLVAELERLDRGTLGHLGPDGNVYATADHDPEVASVIGSLVSRG